MKPWIVINAQNRVIGRYESDTAANIAHSEQVSLNLVNIQYQPRAKNKKARTFP